VQLDTTFAGGVTIGGRAHSPDACVRVKTTNEGYLNAWVADSRGEYNAVDDGSSGIGSTFGSTGSMISVGTSTMQACYTGFRAFYVQGPNSNAWCGSLEVSYDAGSTWVFLVCTMGCYRGTNGADVIVDYDGTTTGGISTSAKCMSMSNCRFTAP